MIRFGPFPTDGYNVCLPTLCSYPLHPFDCESDCGLAINQLFSVDDMLSDATDGEVTSASDVAARGAIVLVTSIWNCDLDHPVDGTFTFIGD